MLSIEMVDLDEADRARGTIVVVDVLRAFTTAAVAFARGAREIWPVATVQEARLLRDSTRGSLAMGEVDGLMIAGFDLSNSPAEMAKADVAGRVLIQRTSAGTQGVVRTVHAEHQFAASFSCAGATVRSVLALNPATVTFIVTGRDYRDGEEDIACAEYMAALLRGGQPDPRDYVPRIAASTAGQLFVDPNLPEFSPGDLMLAEQVDLVDFALPVQRSNGRLSIRRG